MAASSGAESASNRSLASCRRTAQPMASAPAVKKCFELCDIKYVYVSEHV
jgi:hypothetical protein